MYDASTILQTVLIIINGNTYLTWMT